MIERAAEVTIVVAGQRRAVPLDLWSTLEGPKPADGFECDGCSCSPDTWRGVPLWIACAIHDHHYSDEAPLGGTWASRREADAILRRNLLRVLLHYKVNAASARWVAWLYWGRVRIWGTKCYSGWEAGEQPADLPRWQRVREVYGLFRDRRTA